MTGATPPYRWCTLYVDAADPATVVADLRRLPGVAVAEQGVVTVSSCTLEVGRNPDRTESGQVLDWRTMVGIHAGQVPDRQVVDVVTRLMAHLRAAGHRVAADCDFADELR